MGESKRNFNRFLFLKNYISFSLLHYCLAGFLPKISSEYISATVIICGSLLVPLSLTCYYLISNSLISLLLGINLSSMIHSSLLADSDFCMRSDPFLVGVVKC